MGTTTDSNHDNNNNTIININSLPRNGCSIDFLKQLCRYKPKRILYMSCDPATQARDIKYILEQSGGDVDVSYQIINVQPFDLFPQTRHIECLTVLEKI